MPNVHAEQYYGFSALAVGTTNVAPFASLNSATVASMTLEGSAIRYRLDGVSAASGSGHLLTASQILYLRGADAVKGFNAICPTVTGTVMASWGTK